MKKQRVAYLDFIRIVATLLIVIYHFNIQIGLHNINAPELFIQSFKTENIGSLGISLFILISGASLMKNYGGDPFDWKRFYKRRVASIFIIFWIAYVGTWLSLYWINGHLPYNGRPPIWTFLLTLFGLDGFLYYRFPNFYLCGEWFLGLIIIFYIIFPVLRCVVNSSKWRVYLVILLVSYIFVVPIYDKLFMMDIVRNPITRLPDFYIGMCIGKYMKKEVTAKMGMISCLALVLLYSLDLKINHIFIALIGGVLSFWIMMYVMQSMFVSDRIKGYMAILSTYSFGVILTHHNIIGCMLGKFNGRELSLVENYSLFFCCFSVIMVSSFILTQIAERVKKEIGRGF